MAQELTPVAFTVHPDEKAWGLVELEMTPAEMSKEGRRFAPESYTGRHRYQIVWVNRADALAMHVTDMGEGIETGPVRIVSYFEDSVAELREMADQWRASESWERQVLADLQGESTLWGDFLQQQDDLKKQLRNESVFGPAINIPRNNSLGKVKV